MSQTTLSLLIVDDEVNILRSMRRLFKQAGYEVFTAESGRDALVVLEQESVQVVLSDFRMPQMNGGELLDNIKQQYPHIISLILSGYADFDSVLAVMNKGSAFKFLTKPWDNKELLESIDSAFVEYQNQLHREQSLGSSTFSTNIIEFNHNIDSLTYHNHDFSVGYFSLSNSNDLKRNNIDIQQLFDELTRYLTDNWEYSNSIFCISDHSLLLLTDMTKQDIHLEFAQLVNGIEDGQWHSLSNVKVDVSVSVVASEHFDSSPNFIIETLQEGAVLISANSEFLMLNQQYLLQRQRQLIIKSDVTRALQMNQFSLVYQPKITVQTGLIEGAEILLRWRHDTLGWVSPGEFIDIAEADGQINDIGEWVIDNGIAELSRLSRICHEIKSFSINVSASQLMNIKIVQTLKNALQKYQVQANKIEIEVTETSLIKNLSATSRTLNALKDIGIKIAIDDFGVGYSSFAYLTKLPIDILKLDRALLEDIEYNEDTQLLVENLVSTCHNLNIEVVAEGIESKAALDKVNITNCDYVQGFFYSAAVSSSEIEKLFVQQPFRIRHTQPTNSAIN